MVEYAVLASRNFGEALHGAWYDVTQFLSGVPFYWYIVAAVALLILIKVLSGK